MKVYKIAYFVSRLEFGGVESFILNYVNHMHETDCFDFHVITQDINSEACVQQFKDNHITVHIVPHKRKGIWKNVVAVNKILKTERFDIIHSHMNLTNFYVLFLGWLHGTKVRICHVHSVLRPNGFKQRIAYPILEWVNKRCANYYIACGRDAGNFFYGKKAMKEGSVSIFNNAIELEKFQFDVTRRQLIRKKYGIAPDEFVIGHIGRFYEVKNHAFLVEIFADFKKKHANAKLLLVGDGELRKEVERQCCDLGVRDSVIFAGTTQNPEDYYQAMDLFMLTSFFEGLPMVSIEAQCADLPCVFSDRIDPQCQLLEKVAFLPIEWPASKWASAIESYMVSPRCQTAVQVISDAGYDIKKEAQRLSEYYISAMKLCKNREG